MLRSAFLRLQVRHILLGVLGLISLVAVGAVGWNAIRVLQDLRTVHWLVQSNEMAETSLRLNAAAAMERGITSVLMAGSRFVRESGLEEMGRQRLTVDRLHAEIIASARALVATRPDPSLKRSLERLAATRGDFLQARVVADRHIETGQSGKVEAWIERSSVYIEAVAQVRRAVLGSATTLDHVYRDNSLVKEAFYAITEFAGRERAIIGSAIAAHRPLTESERQTLMRYRTVVDMALGRGMQELGQAMASSPVAAARKHMEAVFLGRFQEIRRDVYRASDTGTPYPIGPLDWYREATTAIDTVLVLSDSVSRQSRADVGTVELDAHWMLWALFATCLLVVLAFGLTFLVIRYRILRPLQQLCRGAQTLGSGSLDTPLPRLESHDEFRFLRDVLESMRVHLNADIGRRERAEGDLRKLAGVVEQSTEAVVIVDKHQIIEYVNPAFEAMRGYKSEEVVGRTLDYLRSDGNTGNDCDCLQVVLHEGENYSATLQNRRKNGEVFYEETAVVPLRDVSGSVTHMVMTGRDVTDRTRAQEELRTLHRAIEQSVSSVIITDPEGVTQYVNPQFTRTTGYASDEVVGHKLNLIRSEETPAETYRELWCMIKAGEVWEGELLNRKKSGEQYWELVSISPVVAEDGRITHFVGIQHDVTHRKAMEERLNQLAYYDDLTSLPNRALLRDRLTQAIAYAKRKATRFAVLFIDLDRFKLINDGLGHETGDQVIRYVADRLRGWSRAADTVARYGGDEFVVIMLDVEQPEEVAATALRLLESIRQPITILEEEFRTTCSIGASLYPEDGREAGVLLRNADAAMYRAKETGRNRISFYTEDLNVQATQRLMLESELRRAIERREFMLFYQPQISLLTNRIIGMEALIRWNHPDGIIPPDRFLPVAEETGLIIPIGEWVLQEACRQVRKWQDAGLSPVKVAVNVSARQLEHAGLVGAVIAATTGAGISPELLELEITESMVMAHPDAADEILARLKAVGVTLALDDFGTGYSSLAYLRRFPFDKLKIDRSFVRHISSDPDEAVIATTITSMARALCLSVIAEGVETAEQACYLRRHGCNEIQGFLFSPPLPANKASAWLEGRKVTLDCESNHSSGVLLVDSDADVLTTLKRVLRNEPWHVSTARSETDALAALAAQETAVVVGNSVSLLTKIKETNPATITVLLATYAELAAMTASEKKESIYRFLTKPWNDLELIGVLYDAFAQYKRHKAASLFTGDQG